MGSFGERLRREREMRGISLDEMATATKISARNLQALEQEKFSQLPGGIFNKGFVRAYAKFLGIDEEQAVAEYVTASQDTEAARDQKLQADLSKVQFKRPVDEEEREILLEPKSQWGTIAVIVLIAVAGFGGYEVYQKRKAERAQADHAVQQSIQTASPLPPSAIAPPAQTAAQPTQPSLPNNPSPEIAHAGATATITATKPESKKPSPSVSDSSSADASKPNSKSDLTPSLNPELKPLKKTSETASGPIDVKIHADEKCWISIIADGKTIMEGDLDASSEKAVRAKEKVVLVLGNAAGVQVSYNGKPLENIGGGQKVKKITFTPDGYE